MTITVRRCRATGSTTRAVIATGWAGRCAAITLVTGSLVYKNRVSRDLRARRSVAESQTVRGQRTIVTSAVLILVVHGSHARGFVDGRKREAKVRVWMS